MIERQKSWHPDCNTSEKLVKYEAKQNTKFTNYALRIESR